MGDDIGSGLSLITQLSCNLFYKCHTAQDTWYLFKKIFFVYLRCKKVPILLDFTRKFSSIFRLRSLKISCEIVDQDVKNYYDTA